MNSSQKKQCHAIIHSHAVAAAAGNAVPVPGLGIAADIVAMTSMTMSLCAVFGGNIREEAAKTLAIAAIKNTMLKQPIRILAKELSKLIPGLGQVVAPSITVVMLEAAGWVLAEELEHGSSEKKAKRSHSGDDNFSELATLNVSKKTLPKKAAVKESLGKKDPAKTTPLKKIAATKSAVKKTTVRKISPKKAFTPTKPKKAVKSRRGTV